MDMPGYGDEVTWPARDGHPMDPRHNGETEHDTNDEDYEDYDDDDYKDE